MGIGKSVQFNIFCENYLECNGFEDFSSFDTMQIAKCHFKKLGYKCKNDKWFCSACFSQKKYNTECNRERFISNNNINFLDVKDVKTINVLEWHSKNKSQL